MGQYTGHGVPHRVLRRRTQATARAARGGQDFLGSLEVTTNKDGQVIFDVPYSPPAGLPVITATATDPEGNTSEVTASRDASLYSDPPSAPDQPIAITSGPDQAVSIDDPDAGPLEPTWSLTLSAQAGSLWLSSTSGLVGSGDGTGFLAYSGPLFAINYALRGLRYLPPPGYQGFTSVHPERTIRRRHSTSSRDDDRRDQWRLSGDDDGR